jgi:hypothetical protein
MKHTCLLDMWTNNSKSEISLVFSQMRSETQAYPSDGNGTICDRYQIHISDSGKINGAMLTECKTP